jgi:hypothetical protein
MLVASNVHDWQLLVFDTGPLWELILYSAVHNLRFGLLERELRYLTKPAYHNRLTEFIQRFPHRATSSQVISEIGAWILRTRKPGHTDVWRIVYDEFSSMAMDEESIKLVEMRLGLVADKGIADASVLHLGLRFAERRPQILTIDAGLVADCKRNGLNAVHLWEVIA